jgi:dephospho-CoA kinase
MLERHGAVVIDADDLARDAVDPGTPGYEQVVEAFGRQLITDGGDVDRERLAQLVFADPEARKQLESIVHPEVARRFAQALEPYLDTDRVVVYVVPLLVERSLQAAFDVVVAISASPEVREERLRADRGMNPEDVRGRMAAQLSDAERARDANMVIENEGSLEQLDRVVDDLWSDLRRRAEAAESG